MFPEELRALFLIHPPDTGDSSIADARRRSFGSREIYDVLTGFTLAIYLHTHNDGEMPVQGNFTNSSGKMRQCVCVRVRWLCGMQCKRDHGQRSGMETGECV